MFLLLLPAVMLVLLVGAFVRTAYHGTRAALYVEPLSPLHRESANRTLWFTAFLALSLEVVLWLGALPRIGHGGMFVVHLLMAVIYVALILVMRFLLTGKHSRGMHIVLGSICTMDFIGMVGTGAVLLFRALLA